jgi:glucosamine--fructose-6-phosphate aminotransferase (isomerizing)
MSEPELRPGPPWIMEEMVAAQPSLPAAILGLGGELAAAVRAAPEPVAVIGCGTSEHGAMAIAALLRRAGVDARSRQSLDAAEEPWPGLCIGVSHDGGTRATQLALDAAGTSALVTVSDASADVVLRTPLHDDSWCHTVAYTSAILAGAAVARELGLEGVDAAAAEAVLRAGEEPDAAELAGASRILVAGAGVDEITARELALKIAEGARIPTTAHHLETLLHGHLAGEDARSALVLVESGGGRPARRAEQAARAFAALGCPVHRLSVPEAPGLEPTLARLLGGAIALQRLTLALVAARGVNPDLIRRDEPAYRQAAAEAEEGSF